MITRHFYHRDAVADALVLAAGAFRDPLRKQKLAFWSYELVLSEEWDILYETLEKAVLKHGYPLSALKDLRTDRQNMDLLRTVVQSLQSLCALPSPYPTPPASEADRRRAVADAVRHGRTERILRLVAGLAPKEVADILGIPYKSGMGVLYMLGLSGLPTLVCPPACPPAWPPVWPPTLPVGRLSARLFSLPKHLLVQKPLHPCGADLLETGCAFWRTRLAEFGCVLNDSRLGSRLVFPTDDAMEEFYGLYFPDDIPDEWSVQERAKSHLTEPGSLPR